MSRRVLFLVNGLGLGNSTRCHAIIQRLAERGATIAVVTSGNGLWYFKDRPEVDRVFEIEELRYGNKEGRISIAATLASLADFARIMSRNAGRVATAAAEFRPAVAVVDSVYTFRPLRKAGVPIVALNNADVVYQSFHRFTDRPASIKPQFYVVEQLDYLFHRLVPDLVVSPNLDPSLPNPGGRFRRIGPIVRRDYTPAPARSAPQRVVVMLSGSTFGTPVVLDKPSYPVHIDVVGREPPAGRPPPANVRYHGKIRSTLDLLRDADLVVVNGGFSAVSETFCMHKPVIVVPVPRHAEQWINARTIQHLGVGLMAAEDSFEEVMLAALPRVPEFKAAYQRIGAIADGAATAADLILASAGAGPR